ncbi:hypothetical protein AV530_010713 [Patagioenas fasciata monilis]|uniref:Uncharacterized protein n=1 Tax=Patagioenas fasciata monilis TaxID=372326 RepID=A0A1V4K7H0_PATFA|nr:hypothetical protein AV530_010713 [Patagioenas fasciata monilis]
MLLGEVHMWEYRDMATAFQDNSWSTPRCSWWDCSPGHWEKCEMFHEGGLQASSSVMTPSNNSDCPSAALADKHKDKLVLQGWEQRWEQEDMIQGNTKAAVLRFWPLMGKNVRAMLGDVPRLSGVKSKKPYALKSQRGF